VLANVTVDGGGTLTATPGSVMKNVGTLVVESGGMLRATGASFTGLPGFSYHGLSARAGATVEIGGSTLSGATVGLEANPDWLSGRTYAAVSVLDSTFSGNGTDISNGFKDVPWGAAVNAARSSALSISSHSHLCMPPPNSGLPLITRTLYDVEGIAGRVDSLPCPITYTELDGHPNAP